jgi:hypothetical protein
VSADALLLVRRDLARTAAWARGGLVEVFVAPLEDGWVAVLPCGSASAARAPYDDAVSALLARPVPRRLHPSLGVAFVGPRLVLAVTPAVLRPRRRWLVWEPGAGLVRPGNLQPGTVGDLAAASGDRAGLRERARAAADVLRDGRGEARAVAAGTFSVLGLPGAAFWGRDADPTALSGVLRVEPDSKDVRRFERAIAQDRRWREEVDAGR